MRILNLHTENIKKIKAIDITPEGDTVVVTGKNGNGKSSTLDSICMVLGGKKLIPSKPVREGEETAKISVDIGDYQVTRHWTSPETSYLKVQTKDGANITNAQMILNKLIGDLSFDPLAFSTMDPSKRFDVLRKISKVDLSALTKEHGEVYDQRTQVARDGKTFNTRLESDEFKDLPNFADKVDDAEEIKKQRVGAVSVNRELELNTLEVESLETSLKARREQSDKWYVELREIQEKIDDCQEAYGEEQTRLEYAKKLAAKQPVDLTQFDAKLEKYYQYQKATETQDRKKAVEQDRDYARKEWDRLDAKLKEIDKAKKDMVAAADMPIDGLGFGDKEILFKGIPFAQLSMSEQIQVSIAIAIAMNPRLRVAMIYNGSLLDDDSMATIAKIAAEKDIQIWIERVASKPEGNAIFIENGERVH